MPATARTVVITCASSGFGAAPGKGSTRTAVGINWAWTP
jgi:NADP-dependent 3-hydroxy acid dehydrogenase YdfG